MVALAERFAAEGQMNLNKYLEAAVYAKTRHAAWQYRPEVTAESMQGELEASIQILKSDQAGRALVPGLEMGLANLSEQKYSDLQIIDAPDVFVCRICGYAALSTPPERCPDCGSWPGSFRKFVAFFNGDNLEPTNPLQVIRLLGRNAVDIARLVRGLSEEQLTQTLVENEWSLREHVAHFYDTQEMLETRLDLMLTQDDPDLVAVAVYEFATEGDRHPPTTAKMLLEFVDRRAKTVKQLEDLPLKDLWRTGHHPEFGQLTVIRQVAYLAYHEQSHLAEIGALRDQVL
jgi:hypothetical protein